MYSGGPRTVWKWLREKRAQAEETLWTGQGECDCILCGLAAINHVGRVVPQLTPKGQVKMESQVFLLPFPGLRTLYNPRYLDGSRRWGGERNPELTGKIMN